MRVSNYAGVRGKKKLDPDMMANVRNLVYETFPLPPGESEHQNWQKTCAKAIDEKCRRKPPKKISF